ncbi:unnamed protein product [Closterium sp. NIES-64]|nr:unnamed protein product [Closterium sp. NIES-64]
MEGQLARDLEEVVLELEEDMVLLPEGEINVVRAATPIPEAVHESSHAQGQSTSGLGVVEGSLNSPTPPESEAIGQGGMRGGRGCVGIGLESIPESQPEDDIPPPPGIVPGACTSGFITPNARKGEEWEVMHRCMALKQGQAGNRSGKVFRDDAVGAGKGGEGLDLGPEKGEGGEGRKQRGLVG